MPCCMNLWLHECVDADFTAVTKTNPKVPCHMWKGHRCAHFRLCKRSCLCGRLSPLFASDPGGTEPVKDTNVLPAEPQGAAFLVHMCVPAFEEELPDVFPNVRTHCTPLWLQKICAVLLTSWLHELVAWGWIFHCGYEKQPKRFHI